MERGERITLRPPRFLVKVKLFRTTQGIWQFTGDASCIEVEAELASGYQMSADREGRPRIVDIEGGGLLSAEEGVRKGVVLLPVVRTTSRR